MRRLSWVAASVLALAAAGCGIESTEAESVPPRPDVPHGWQSVRTDEGDVEAAIPSRFVVVGTTGAISGYPEPDAPESAIWMVIGPTTHELRPNQTIDEWVDESGWLTAQREGVELGAVQRDELRLPAGPALEFTASYRAAGREAWTVVYALDLGEEISVMRFGGDGPVPDELPDDFALIRDLLVFPTR